MSSADRRIGRAIRCVSRRGYLDPRLVHHETNGLRGAGNDFGAPVAISTIDKHSSPSGTPGVHTIPAFHFRTEIPIPRRPRVPEFRSAPWYRSTSGGVSRCTSIQSSRKYPVRHQRPTGCQALRRSCGQLRSSISRRYKYPDANKRAQGDHSHSGMLPSSFEVSCDSDGTFSGRDMTLGVTNPTSWIPTTCRTTSRGWQRSSQKACTNLFM